jgi:beta-lactamase superfamily II metal-dependent hydrolase
MKRGADDDSEEESKPKKRKLETQEKVMPDYREIMELGKLFRAAASLQIHLKRLDRDQVLDAAGFALLPEATLKLLKKKIQNAIVAKTAADRVEKANKGVVDAYVVSGNPNGEFVIMFMNIGTGDCILIKTPKGKTIVVDCGQRGTGDDKVKYKFIQDMLVSPTFLDGDKKELYALIVTHPDIDHYVDVTKILKPKIGKIRHIFYSLSIGNYNLKSTYDYFKKATYTNQVEISGNRTGIPVTNRDPVSGRYKLEPGSHWIQILGLDRKYDGWDEDNLTIHLLAGGITPITADTAPARYQSKVRKRTPGEAANCASIVTLIQVFGRKILLCGDATYSTEVFLNQHHKAMLKEVDLAQMEHHGSGTAHAGGEYVENLNPYIAVASSGQHKNDWNPRWRSISKYLGVRPPGKTVKVARRILQGMDEHLLIYAVGDSPKGFTDSKTNDWSKKYKQYGLYTTRSNGDLHFIVDKNGNLIRKFSKNILKTDTEPAKIRTTTYTIAKNGTVTKDEKTEKATK